MYLFLVLVFDLGLGLVFFMFLVFFDLVYKSVVVVMKVVKNESIIYRFFRIGSGLVNSMIIIMIEVGGNIYRLV